MHHINSLFQITTKYDLKLVIPTKLARFFGNCFSRIVHLHGSHMDWKNGKTFSSQEKSGNFELSGKVREFQPGFIFIFLSNYLN